MSFGPDIEVSEDLSPVRLRFIDLWAKYPDREAKEIAENAFKLCGVEPGFRFAQMAAIWANDIEVLELRDAKRPLARNPDALVPSKDVLVAELVELARNPAYETKDRVAAYAKALEAEGHIGKAASKPEDKDNKRPPAIIFKAVDFNREPDAVAEDAA